MRGTTILGLLSAVLVVFGSATANALALDATIAGIFTDSSLSTPIAGLAIDADGNATAPLTAGDAILVNVNIDNTLGEAIETIAASIVFQGDQTNYVGGLIPGSILQEAGIGGASLGNLGSGAIKCCQPNIPGEAADIWLQALAYGTPGGVDGSGTQTANIQLLFIVTGAAGGDSIDFAMGFTPGDVITAPGGDPIPATFSGATVNIPEPGTALLTGLGLAGLAGAGRRRN